MKKRIAAGIAAALFIILFSVYAMTRKEPVQEDNSEFRSFIGNNTDPENKPITVTSPPVGSQLVIDESYFEILNSTYEDLSSTYGAAVIRAGDKAGLYAIFESERIICYFDSSIYSKHYDSYESWLADSNEFEMGGGYGDALHYIGNRYTFSDFVVNEVKVYNDGVNTFFGYGAPVTISMVNEHFNRAAAVDMPDEMYEIYTTPVYEYGEYSMYFEIMNTGRDYDINLINLWKNPYEPQLLKKAAAVAAKEEQLSRRELFLAELPGTWHFEDSMLKQGENFYIDIANDLTFSATHATDRGAVEFTGNIVPKWESDEQSGFPYMLIFVVIEQSHMLVNEGGSYEISMAMVDGVWQLHLYKARGGLWLFDMVKMSNSHTLYREAGAQVSITEPKKNEEFVAKVWDMNGDTGIIWLEEGKIEAASNRFISDMYQATGYKLASDTNMKDIGEGLYIGETYLFTCDSDGVVNKIAKAVQDMDELFDDVEMAKRAWALLDREAPGYRAQLTEGKKALYTGNTTIIDGKTCYMVSIGTDNAEHFVSEIHYALDLKNERVYILNLVDAIWLLVE